ncbi:E3 SUMO-protein ligase RanBP2 [Nymphon striatum]|nr:E3 SUMO-protein ligase RanBP2 [Nymphon striatum]
MTDIHKDLANMKIIRDYVTDGYSQGPAQNYPMRHPGPPLSFPDPMYRLNLDSRMPAHASGYYHSPLGYGSPMLRMPPPMQSMAVPPPSAHIPSLASVHPFQIAMPASAVTLKKSPFGHEPLQQPTTPNDINANRSYSFSSDKDVDYNPKSPDFKPVIPLPDEVPVFTGEENEIVRFEQKAKLYRFDNDGKEWKERGVGIVKMLVNEELEKARLVMRRDQVHRICANHQLVSGMKLLAKKDSNHMWIWSAQDFSEEEIQTEKFCIRFKEVDDAAKFKTEFDLCVSNYGQIKNSVSTASVTNAKVECGFGDQFKLKPGTWSCNSCCIVNESSATACVACNSPNLLQSKMPISVDKISSSTNNEVKFSTPNKADQNLVSKSTSGSSAKSGFNFGSFSFSQTEKSVGSTEGFQFSKPISSSGFTFNKSSVIEPNVEYNEKKSAESNINSSGTIFGGFSFSKTADNKVSETKPEENKPHSKEKEKAAPFSGFTFLPTTTGGNSSSFKFGVSDSKVGGKKDLSEISPGDFKVCSPSVKPGSTDVTSSGKSPNQSKSEEPVVPLPDVVDEKNKNTRGPKSLEPKDVSNSFGDTFKLNTGKWECQTCCIFNEAGNIKCVACSTPKPGLSADQLVEGVKQNTGKVSGEFPFNVTNNNGSNTIPENNSNSNTTFGFTFNAKPTFTFGNSKPSNNSNDAKPSFSFGFNPSTASNINKGSKSTFTFGQNNQATSAETKSSEKENKKQFASDGDSNFPPSSSQSFLSSSSCKIPPSPKNHSGTPRTSESFEEVEPSDADNVYFQPVIDLPPRVDLKTGEEEEETLYEHKAKLFRMANKEWKERGIGDIKLLWNEKTKKARLIMRRDQVLKLCCNHYLTEDMNFINMDQRSFIWHAYDFSEDEPSNEKFAVRFKNADIACTFLNAINAAKCKKSIDSHSDENNKSLKDHVSELNESDSAGPQEINSNSPREAHVSALDSFSFKLDGSKCESDEDNFQTSKSSLFGDGFSFGSGLPSVNNAPSAGFVFGQSVFGNQSKPSQEDGEVEIVYERKASPEDVALAKKYLLPDNFFLYKELGNCSGCRGCIEEESETESVSKQPPAATPGLLFLNNVPEKFSFAALAAKNSVQDPPSEPVMFENVSDRFSFAPSVNKDFKFAGLRQECLTSNREIGALIGIDLLKGGSDKENSTNENHDPHFEPIVPLPDLVEVSTGEEEENVLFSQRAKLYRYDSSTKQWKERGIDKFRIILRRDQVHKIACNHYITSEIDVKEHPMSANAVSWQAMDFAESECVLENFSAKFKTQAIAADFKSTFDDCKSKLENIEHENNENDEKDVMFSRDATLSVWEKSNFEVVGQGKLEMLHNQESNGALIQMYNDSDNKQVCNHMVSMRMEIKMIPDNSTNIEWWALDSSHVDGPEFKKFQATFANFDDVQEFTRAFDKGKEYANKFQIEVCIFMYHQHLFIIAAVAAMEDQFYNADESDDVESFNFMEENVYLGIMESGITYKEMGKVRLTMNFDDDYYGTRLRATLENGRTICDHIIAVETTLRIDELKNEAFWTAKDDSIPQNPTRRSFRATFPSTDATNNFEIIFNEGKNDAVRNGIVETEDLQVRFGYIEINIYCKKRERKNINCVLRRLVKYLYL